MNPEQIGRYKIIRELGRGGMATVFLAHDPRFDRDVAIKVLPREFLHDPSFRSRFEREGRTIASLEHPAIVPVYDFGEEDGQPYMVMRHMAGGSLADKLHGGPLPLAEAGRILQRIAPAIDKAHRQGIIHRDLKPENILFDEEGHPYIADFGIAKLTERHTNLTGSGVIGTPVYMSPEQFDSDQPLDHRSDLYGLGIIIFEMLSGVLPFAAATPVRVMKMHLMDPGPRVANPSESLPAAIQHVLERALAKKPADRFQSARALAEALTRATSANAAAPRTQTLVIGKFGGGKSRLRWLWLFGIQLVCLGMAFSRRVIYGEQ